MLKHYQLILFTLLLFFVDNERSSIQLLIKRQTIGTNLQKSVIFTYLLLTSQKILSMVRFWITSGVHQDLVISHIWRRQFSNSSCPNQRVSLFFVIILTNVNDHLLSVKNLWLTKTYVCDL